MLARVALRLKAAGGSATVAHAIITNHTTAIIRGARSKHGHVLVVRGWRGEVVRAGALERAPRSVILPLGPAWDGLIEAIREVRREQPTIVLWNRELPIEDAIRRTA
jgi:hypothetical protein